jgi:hypothetical protein
MLAVDRENAIIGLSAEAPPCLPLTLEGRRTRRWQRPRRSAVRSPSETGFDDFRLETLFVHAKWHSVLDKR